MNHFTILCITKCNTKRLRKINVFRVDLMGIELFYSKFSQSLDFAMSIDFTGIITLSICALSSDSPLASKMQHDTTQDTTRNHIKILLLFISFFI